MKSIDEKFDLMLSGINGLTQNTNALVSEVRGVSKRVDYIEETIGSLTGRMDVIENAEEITYAQQNTIDSLISKTVYDRLGIGKNPSKWTMEERVTNEKYGRLFRKRLRRDVSNKGHLAYPFRTTTKGNFKLACDDIIAWYPAHGISELMREADEKAEARRLAREQGY